jgi:hypothetical protein
MLISTVGMDTMDILCFKMDTMDILCLEMDIHCMDIPQQVGKGEVVKLEQGGFAAPKMKRFLFVCLCVSMCGELPVGIGTHN